MLKSKYWGFNWAEYTKRSSDLISIGDQLRFKIVNNRTHWSDTFKWKWVRSVSHLLRAVSVFGCIGTVLSSYYCCCKVCDSPSACDCVTWFAVIRLNSKNKCQSHSNWHRITFRDVIEFFWHGKLMIYLKSAEIWAKTLEFWEIYRHFKQPLSTVSLSYGFRLFRFFTSLIQKRIVLRIICQKKFENHFFRVNCFCIRKNRAHSRGENLHILKVLARILYSHHAHILGRMIHANEDQAIRNDNK